MSNLRGRTAVVTGSTTGIGLAIAQSFAKAGVNIVINGFGNPDDIEKERSRIEADFGVKAIYSPADMTRPAEIGEMISFGEKTFGSVDILVNNAGIQFVSPIEEFPIEKWDAIIAINLSSAFHAIRTVVPGMKKRGWGASSTPPRRTRWSPRCQIASKCDPFSRPRMTPLTEPRPASRSPT
jgi:3-hydroxybutyrate dehydrogenase